MKEKRQNKILDLIQAVNIDTQEELQRYLNESGFKVTQATVSRDIKELKLIKTASESGTYKYSLPESFVKQPRFKEILTSAIVSVDFALNTVVVKCHTGMAQAACAAIDSMTYEEIVGTIAGDDTIFILLRSEDKASSFVKTLNSFLFRQ